MKKQNPKTKEEARDYAIEWQRRQSIKELSYSELLEWQIIFEEIANTFGLYDEFKENGII